MAEMVGADPDALEEIARELRRDGARLDGARRSLRAQIHSTPWTGPGADIFRSRWDGEYGRMLDDAVGFLDSAAATADRNATQQRDASGVAVPGRRRGAPKPHGSPTERALDSLLPGWQAFAPDWQDWAKLPFDVTGALGDVAEARTVHVSSYLRDGSVVREHYRWAPGTADDMRRFLGSADDLVRHSGWIQRGGVVLDVAFAGYDGWEQWQGDGAYGDGERAFRATAVTGGKLAIGLGAGWAGAQVGAAIGTAIPVPVVGTVVGAVVGFGVGYGISHLADSAVGDHLDDAASWVWDRGEDVVELGGDALDAGGDLLEGGANLVERGWDAVF
jgi:hypothetical protein